MRHCLPHVHLPTRPRTDPVGLCRSHARHTVGRVMPIEQHATRSVEGGLSLPGRKAEGPSSQNCTTGRTAIPAALRYFPCCHEVPIRSSGNWILELDSDSGVHAGGTVSRFDRDGRKDVALSRFRTF